MSARTPSNEAVVAALCEALAPYPWRRFTPELLARFALAARDRHQLTAVLTDIQGVAVGTWETLEPADRDDARVTRIVADLCWARGLPATCRNLVGVLCPELR